MKTGTIFVAVLFGPGARVGELFAPGDADCRWRAAATLEREAVNDASANAAESPGIVAATMSAGLDRAETNSVVRLWPSKAHDARTVQR